MSLTLSIIKKGFEGKEITLYASLHYIMFYGNFEYKDEIIIPESYKDVPLTHLGYMQDSILAHVRYHDWHHPSQGDGDYYPTEYFPKAQTYGENFPTNLKRIHIPKTVQYISSGFFQYINNCPNVVIEIDPENPYFKIENNTILKK